MKNKIWILHADPIENAKLLDDKILSDMIMSCAQVLCNVHFLAIRMRGDVSWAFGRMENDAPLPPKHDHDEWSLWGKDCLANYNALLAYAAACCREYGLRFREIFEDERGQRITHYKKHELYETIEWCGSNKPDLPNCNNERKACTPWPLVTPDKYVEKGTMLCEYYDILHSSYRNYYRAYLQETKYLVEKRIGVCGTVHTVRSPVKHVWTRRERPNWLGDL